MQTKRIGQLLAHCFWFPGFGVPAPPHIIVVRCTGTALVAAFKRITVRVARGGIGTCGTLPFGFRWQAKCIRFEMLEQLT